MPSNIRYDMLPFHMQDGARLYIEEGIPPGDFMMAVLSNDLKEAFGRADETNRVAMFDWASWLYNECPMQANGSPEKVAAWLDAAAAEEGRSSSFEAGN